MISDRWDSALDVELGKRAMGNMLAENRGPKHVRYVKLLQRLIGTRVMRAKYGRRKTRWKWNVSKDDSVVAGWHVEHQRNMACDGKKAFEKRGHARGVRDAIAANTGERMWIYECHFCGKYHLGHHRSTGKRGLDGKKVRYGDRA